MTKNMTTAAGTGAPLPILIKAAARFVSKDPSRRVLNGILLDAENKVLVATDGRRIIVIPAKVRGKTRTIAAHNIKEIPAKPAVPRGWGNRGSEAEKRIRAIKKGNPIRDSFPNWKMVVPAETVKHGTLDVAASMGRLATEIEARKDTAGTIWVLVSAKGLFRTPLDARFLMDALKSLVDTGATDVTYETSPPGRYEWEKPETMPAVLRGDNGTLAVIMPGNAGGASGEPLVFQQE